jgi:hypothetical protein
VLDLRLGLRTNCVLKKYVLSTCKSLHLSSADKSVCAKNWPSPLLVGWGPIGGIAQTDHVPIDWRITPLPVDVGISARLESASKETNGKGVIGLKMAKWPNRRCVVSHSYPIRLLQDCPSLGSQHALSRDARSKKFGLEIMTA